MSEETLFHESLARPAAERAAFLDAACADQPDLRGAVEALLAAHEASGSLLDRPPADPGQTVDSEPAPARPGGTGEFTPQPGEAPPEAAATTDLRPSFEPGIIIAGRYMLQEKIGEGGMGEVWVAKQTEPVKRRVALKLIKTGMDSRAVLARFDQERQALALMDHPNIARVLDGGVDLVPEPRTLVSGATPPLTNVRGSGRPFFVMELVNGLPLMKFCDEARLTPKERLELFLPICQAVQHAHHKGIVHRDLKPANILVTLIDGKGVPKVIDFGVAKATAGKLTDESMNTQFGAMVGTLEYMSPEQAGFSGEDIDTRADIYSLGVILYELLTGLRPIDAKLLKKAALTEMIRIIREEEPSKPSTRLSTDASLASLAALRHIEPKKLMALLRGELDWVVMKCLEKQRERRYETANGLVRDIQRYLADEPVEARPPSAGYRLGKFLKRNKGPVVAAGVVLAALLAGIVGTTLGLVRATKAEEVARTRYEEAEAARAKAAASAKAEAAQRKKAEKAETETLADYRASTDDAIEQLIGSKPVLGAKEKTYLENTVKRWQAFAARQGDDRRSRAIRAEGHFRVAYLWHKLGRKQEARAEYQTARDLFKKLVEQFPAVPPYQQDLASTHNNLGALLTVLGQGKLARVEYQAARDLQKKLVERFPAIPVYQQVLASTHNNLGALLTLLGKGEPARAEYQAARDLQKQLVEQFPAMPAYQLDLARTHNNLGFLFVTLLGKGEEARVEYRAARDLQKQLVEQFPAMPAYQEGLAGTYTNLGILLASLGKGKEARAAYQKAHNIIKTLAEQFPAVTAYQIDLGAGYCNFGNLIHAEGQPAESVPWFGRAIRTLQPVHAQEPRDATAKQFLRNSHWGRAKAYDALKKFAAAVADWDRTIELSPPAERRGLRASRVNAQLAAGQVAQAVAEVAELTKDPHWNAGQWYDFVCVYGVASSKSADKKQEYADRAMELLRQAVKVGWKNAAHMAKDTDLDSLRQRDDFKTLLAELERKPGPQPQKQP